MSNSPLIWGGTGGLGKLLPATSSGLLQTDASGNISTTSSAASAFNVTAQSTAYSANANDYVVCSGASFTVTLPTAVGAAGKQITIQHSGTSLTQVYTIATTASQTIGGVAGGSYALYTNNEILTVISDGSNWQIQDHQTNTAWSSQVVTNWSATTAYVFTFPSNQSFTIGSVWSNNGQQFIVSATTSNTTTVNMVGTGAPITTGSNLVHVSGAGSGTIGYNSATTTGQPAKATTKNNDSLIWRRVGANVEYWIHVGWSSGTGGTTGNGDYVLFLPSNLYFDSNTQVYQPGIGAGNTVPLAPDVWTAGTLSHNVSSGASDTAAVIPYINDTTSGLIAVRIISQAYATGGSFGPINSSSNFSFASNGFGVYLKFFAPIAGWQP